MKMEHFLSKTEVLSISMNGKVALLFPTTTHLSVPLSAQSQLNTDPTVCNNPKSLHLEGWWQVLSKLEDSQNGNSCKSSNTGIFRFQRDTPC